MSDVYSITATGMLDGQKRLETISSNAANASLPGYRRQVAATRSFAADMLAAERSAGSVQGDARPAAASRVDLRKGPVAVTGRELDMAIESDDLFFALSDGTSTWLTRAGAFKIDAAGLLVGERGLRVQGTGGDIRLDGPDIEVQPNGQLLRNGLVVGAVQLFKPTEQSVLTSAGGALLSSSLGVQPAVGDATRLRGAALEGSNAGASTEMIDLLTLTRQFESLVRVTQGYDELLGRTIQKLGEI